MLKIEPVLLKSYKFVLQMNKIPPKNHGYYIKWLRFYLDFCQKYGFREADPGSLPPFIEKLRSKKQNVNFLQQASHAVHLFYALSRQESTAKSYTPEVDSVQNVTARENEKTPSTKGFAKEATSSFPIDAPTPCPAENPKEKWQKALAGLANEIKVRHYSPKTLKSYRGWVYKLQAFLNSKAPELLNSENVKRL